MKLRFKPFPAVGLAIYATQAKRVTDAAFIAAAQSVADQVTQHDLEQGLLYPPQTDILKTEVTAAERVCEVIFSEGNARVPKPKDIKSWLESQLYTPSYASEVATSPNGGAGR